MTWSGLVLLVWAVTLGVRGADNAGRSSLLLGTLGAMLFFLAQHRAERAVGEFVTKHGNIVAALNGPKRCFGRGTIISSPTVRKEGARATNGQAETLVLFSLHAELLDCEGRQFQDLVVRLSSNDSRLLLRNSRIEFVAQLAPVRLFRNRPLSDPRFFAARHGALLSGSALHMEMLTLGTGPRALVDRGRAHVRQRIEATYQSRVSGLGRALVLGESDLNAEELDAFRNSGLLHLLAVSGTHLVLAVLSIVGLLRSILVRITWLSRRFDVTRASSWTGALLSLAYADFSGGSGSAWRAALMLCVVCGGRGLGVRVLGAGALSSSILIGLALDPLYAYDLSFLLSALATWGLLAAARPLSARIRGLKPALLRSILESFIATLASSLACAPALLTINDKMTYAALLSNVVAAPFGELIALPVCLLHTLCGWLPPLEQGLALVGSGALSVVRQIALWSASVQSAQFAVPYPSPSMLSLLCILTLALLAAVTDLRGVLRTRPHGRAPRLRIWTLCIVVLAPLLFAVFGRSTAEAWARPTSSSKLWVTALDVGQGDALLVEFPDGQVALVDGGGFATGVPDTAERVILPYLRARHIDHLDLMVLSHAHPDHIGGLLGVAERLKVNELWVPSYGRSRVLSRLENLVTTQGGHVRGSLELCNKRLGRGAVSLQVLSPCDEIAKTWGANDASLVLHIRYGSRAILLTGDIEGPAEQHLLRTQREQLSADVLKVAHHGSDTSSNPDFVAAVAPRIALISSGIRNRFRHPRPDTLETLDAQGTEIFRTDQLGSISWSTDGQLQEMRAFFAPPRP